jgi:hypothetical protein
VLFYGWWLILEGGRAAPLLPQYCRCSFFHAAGAPFKALASSDFLLKFSECRRWAVLKKKASQSSRTVAVLKACVTNQTTAGRFVVAGGFTGLPLIFPHRTGALEN